MNKLVIVLYTVLSCALLSCSNGSKQGAQQAVKNPAEDTVEIWADTSLRVILNEQKKAFENSYPGPKLRILYFQEEQVVKALMANRSSLAVLHRELTPGESAFLAKKEEYKPREYTIAYDAFVFVTSMENRRDSLWVKDIKECFTAPKPGLKLVFENSHSNAVHYLGQYYSLSASQFSNAFSKNNVQELMDFLRHEPAYIGVIPFSYICDVEADETVKLLENLKVLNIARPDSAKPGKHLLVNPSQESITTRDYPFVMPIVLLDCSMEQNSGTAFVNYIFKPKAQRLILKCGLTPAVFPGREIKVITH